MEMSSTTQASTDLDLIGGDLENLRDRYNGQADDPAQTRRPMMLAGISALTLFFTPQILQLFPSLEGYQIAKVTSITVMLMFLISRGSWSSRVRLGQAPQLMCIIGLLVLATLTMPLAEWRSGSFHYITDVYIKNVIFVYLLAQAVRSDRDCRVVAGVLTLGSTLLVLAILTGVGPLAVAKTDPNRLSIGGTYDSNDLALLFVVTIPFAFFLLKPSRPLVRLFLMGSIVLMLIGMLKTGSRGGFLGLLAIGALIFLRGSRQARKYTLITIALGAALFAAAAPASYWERIGTIYNYQEDYNVNEETGRLTIWKAGLEMIAERPLTGIGIACFNYAEGRINHSKLQQSPHNSFIQVTAELGLPGGFLFLAIIFCSVRMARRVRRALQAIDSQSIWFASAVEVGFLGFLVSGFFLSHAYSAIFCFLAGIGAVLHARYCSSSLFARPQPPEIEYA
jgi:O-antigen ligase